MIVFVWSIMHTIYLYVIREPLNRHNIKISSTIVFRLCDWVGVIHEIIYTVIWISLCLSKVTIDTLERIYSWLFWILATEYWIAFLSIIHVHLLNPGVVGIGVSDIALDESDIPISCKFCGWCVLHDHCAQHPSKEKKGIHFLIGLLDLLH
jgi:hypothetical protein